MRDFLSVSNNKYGVVFVQDTFLKSHKKYYVEGYSVIRRDSAGKFKGGLATLIKNTLSFEEVEIPKDIADHEGVESLIINVKTANSSHIKV